VSPAAGTARSPTAAAPVVAPQPAPSPRPPLRVVGRRSRPRNVRPRRRAWIPIALALGLVVASLLAVVVGQSMLATGQVRLSALQAQLSAEQASHREKQLIVAQLETPSRIVQEAEQHLHMVQPTQVTQLPSADLGAAQHAPNVAPAPPATTTTSPSPATSASPGT
jgi:hypothetical protein